ncbi:phytanoyl-CoA dioxygenase family protein [Armatimonas sp.]|uniref:phytanoyl-CoA dioxygenase family protein n=1 Tax=Armatimonas sp. TaxID=1872638 RepID=UPI0037511A98
MSTDLTIAAEAPTVLNDGDRAHFEDKGYVIVPNAVPPQNVAAAKQAIYDFLSVDPENSDTWYRDPVQSSGNVEMHQHPAFWNNRQHPRLYRAFAEVLGTERLWVSLDRGAFRPPQREDQPRYRASLVAHWDLPIEKIDTLPFGVQGVLALVDTPSEVGGFTCVSGFHKVAVEWVKSRPDQTSRVPDLSVLPPGYEMVSVPMAAGDLLIWNRLLLHGNGYNVSERPRMAQYITMFPAPEGDEWEQRREERIVLWQERRAPAGFPGDPRGWEQANSVGPAELTALGRRLLGIDP